MCSYELWGCVFQNLANLVGSPMAHWSQVGARLRMFHEKNLWRNKVKRELPSLYEAQVPRLEPGSEWGPVGKRLLAGLATEPDRASKSIKETINSPCPASPSPTGRSRLLRERQLRWRTLTDQTRAAEAGFVDLECQPSVRKGARACAGVGHYQLVLVQSLYAK